MVYMLLTIALAATAEGRVRSAEERVTIGECADLSANHHSFFDPLWRISELPSEPVVMHEADVVAAELISLEYFSNFKVVTEKRSKEQYVLTQCGTTPPGDDEVNAVSALGVGFTRKHFTIPLQMVMTDSTVHLGLLAALGLQDRVSHLSKYAVAPCWQKALGCGAQVADIYGGASAEDLGAQRGLVDAVFMDCNWDGNCSNVNSQKNAIHVSASQDPGPLHSAEHVKFIAAFFNKEEVAKLHFTATMQHYASGVTHSSSKPVVAWIAYNAPSSWAVESFTISMATYKMKFVNVAGGDNIVKSKLLAEFGDKVTEVSAFTGSTLTVATSSFNGSKVDASTMLFKVLAEVDAIVDETYAPDPSAYTYESFLDNMGLLAASGLKFVNNQMVFRIDGTQGPPPGNNLDWYESRLAHPDWAVEGLARVLHADASKRRKYFRNVAKGETPEVVSASMCSHELPQCLISAYPEEIPMMMAPFLDQQTGGDEVNSGFLIFPHFTFIVQYFLVATFLC